MSHDKRAREPIAAKEAMRALIVAANRAEPPLGADELRLLNAVMHQLSLFDRVNDRIATKVLAEVSGLSERQTRRLLHRLADRGIGLAYLPGKWKGSPAQIGVGKGTARLLDVSPLDANEGDKSTGGAVPFDRRKGDRSEAKGSQIGGAKGTTSGASVSVSEVSEVSEESTAGDHAHTSTPNSNGDGVPPTPEEIAEILKARVAAPERSGDESIVAIKDVLNLRRAAE